MWSMDYVQVPDERAETPVNEIQEVFPTKKESEEEIKEKKKAAIVKQMSLTTEDNGGICNSNDVTFLFQRVLIFFFITALAKSGSESSISEACDNAKESRKRFEDEKEECSDKEEGDNKNQLGIDKMSMSSTKSMSQLKDSTEVRRRSSGAARREIKLRSVSHIEQQTFDDNDDFENIACGGEKGIRPSKSDTSLTDSFVMIDNDGGGNSCGARKNNSLNMLRDGKPIEHI